MINMFTVWLFLLSLDKLASCETKDVRVALLGAGGRTNVDSSLALIGAKLAVEVINNHSAEVLPGYRLVPYERVSLTILSYPQPLDKHLVRIRFSLVQMREAAVLVQVETHIEGTDTMKCVEEDALDDFYNVIQTFLRNESSSHPMFIIGAGCSVRSQPVAHSAPFWNMIQVAYSSTSPRLSDREAYPNFFRVLLNYIPRHRSQLAYVNYLGYSGHNVGLIVQDEGIFTGALDRIQREYRERGINLQVARFTETNLLELELLFESPPRMLVLNAYEGPARMVFCKAYDMKLMYPDYAWMFPGWYGDGWWQSGRYEEYCSSDIIQKIIPNSITVKSVIPAQNETDVILSSSEVIDHYNSVNESNFTGYREVYIRYAYDAVWVMALALQKSLPLLKEKGLTLEDFHLFTEKGKNISEIVRNVVQDIKFTGVSGNISFLKGTGDRAPSVLILSQIRYTSDGLKSVDFADVIDNFTTVRYHPGESDKTVFKEGIPKDSILVPPRPVYGIIAAFTILATGMSLLFIVFNIWYRKERAVKASSPILNIIAALGSVVWYVILLLNEVPVPKQAVYDVTCPVTLWLTSLGITLLLGPLTLKSWRIYYIFHNPKPNKKILKTWKLLLILLVLIAIDLCVLTILTAIPQTRFSATVERRDDGVFYLVCGASSTNEPDSDPDANTITFVVKVLVFGYKSILALLGLFFAFQTRNIKMKVLRESRQTSAAIFVFLAAAILFTILLIFLQAYPEIEVILSAIVIITAGIMINCFIFLPKVYYLWITKRKKNDSDKDDIDIWSDSEQGANLHQATLASMQREIDSLKEQLTKANKKPPIRELNEIPNSTPYEEYTEKQLKHRFRSGTWSVTASKSVQDSESLLVNAAETPEE